MPRVSMIYDKVIEDDREVSKKFFMVRGDERYARTTDTLITVTETGNNEFAGYYVNINVEVLRCLGSSKCLVYDGDEMIGSFNTTSNVRTHTFSNLLIGYGEHNFRAEFQSNERCIGSVSKTVTSSMDIPAIYQTSLSFDNVIVYPSQTTITKTVELSGGKVSSYYASKTIKVYVDGVESTSATTDNRGVATITLTGLDRGSHSISAEFESDGSLYGSITSQTIDVGYNVNIISYPITFLNDGTDVVVVQVVDNNNNAVSGATVSFDNATAITDSDGIANITVQGISEGTYHASCGGDVSEDIIVDVLEFESITLTAQDGVVVGGKNMRGSELLTATITGESINHIPITFSGDESINGVQYTDSDGVASVVYRGSGKGNVNVTATYGELTSTIAIEDVILYGNKGTITGMYGNTNVITNRYSQYCSFNFGRNGYVELFQTSPVAPDDGWYQLEMNIVSLNISNITSSFKICNDIIVEPSKITAGLLRIVSDSSSIRVYMNGEVIGQITQTGSKTTTLKIQSVGGTATLNFDSLKVKKL